MPDEKPCTRCGETKPAEAFYTQTCRGRPQLSSRCRPCLRVVRQEKYDPERARRRYLDTKARRPDVLRARHRRALARRYGLTLAELDALHAPGVCQVCGTKPTGALHTDHDHATGRVRGALCGRCNALLGLVRDDPDWLRALAAYLDAAAAEAREATLAAVAF